MPLLPNPAPVPSTTHLVLLPSYNTGPRLHSVVTEVLHHWQPVLVVVDGSTDGSELPLLARARTEPRLTVVVLPRNGGKGAAVLAGSRFAQAAGFTHALVMDADGQHPAASIGEFMAASRRQPATLVMGRPVFPPNIPFERRHARKLSTGMVRVELLGSGVADPLFGFRVYRLAPLLAVLGPRRSGRRYDFDTEAAVRLAWAGVPLQNLPAPVRYFSRAEGGVSHFHYLRDNVTLVWLHARLLGELLLWRWRAVLRHRRRWATAAAVLATASLGAPAGPAADALPPDHPALQLAAADPGWRDLAEAFAHHSDTLAAFTERRRFPFRPAPVELRGEVRVSAARGLSLHYTAPRPHTVILDEQGMLIRTAAGDETPPADPRAAAANRALLAILRFDLAALASDFAISGERGPAGWTLTLVARTEAAQRGVGRVSVAGEAATIRRIEFRPSPRQIIEIVIDPPRAPAAFSAAELKEFFR